MTDHVFVKGESRGHGERFLEEITRAYKKAFEQAAKSVRNHKGRTESVTFRAARGCEAFRVDEDAPPVALAVERARELRLRSRLITVNGGLDANRLNAPGVPTVTLGAGQHDPYTIDECADVGQYLDGCLPAILLATEM